MLKTQFAKAFYLCNSFFLVTIPFTANPTPSNAVAVKAEKTGMERSLLKTGAGTKKNIPSGGDFFRANKIVQFRSDEPQIKLNRNGIQFVNKYIKRSSDCLVSVKKRSVIPFNIIDSVFKQYGLPVELKYLAVIESELKPSALSQVGARGPWQFMPETAHILGLKTTGQSDERTNYYKSTIAAARYLKDLYAQFDDWLLVLAAYNGGPKPVYTAIRESGSKNFWVLQSYLPAESREHVKKFIATHYYFEGRGSETTLTRAENAEYIKTVNRFLKSHPAADISITGNLKSVTPMAIQKSRNLASVFDMKQIFGYGCDKPINNPQENKNIAAQSETSEQKFKRIMKESEESLQRSRKII